MPAIFISHSSKDRQASGDIKAALTARSSRRSSISTRRPGSTSARTGRSGSTRHSRAARPWCWCSRRPGSPPMVLRRADPGARARQGDPAGSGEPLGGQLVLPDIQAVDLVDWNAGGLSRGEAAARDLGRAGARLSARSPRPPYPGSTRSRGDARSISTRRGAAPCLRGSCARTQGGARFAIIIGRRLGTSLLAACCRCSRSGVPNVILPDIRPESADGSARQALRSLPASCDLRDWHAKLSGAEGASDARAPGAGRARRRGARRNRALPVDQFGSASPRRPRPSAPPFSPARGGSVRDLPFMAIAPALRRAGGPDLVRASCRPLGVPAHCDAAGALSEADRGAGRGRQHHGRQGPVRAHRPRCREQGALPLLAHMLALLYQRGAGQDAEPRHTRRSAIARAGAVQSIRLAADEAIARRQADERELDALRDAFGRTWCGAARRRQARAPDRAPLDLPHRCA